MRPRCKFSRCLFEKLAEVFITASSGSSPFTGFMLGMLLSGPPAGWAANGIVGKAHGSIEIMRLNRKNKVFVAIDTQN
jgi:hypothetical protein